MHPTSIQGPLSSIVSTLKQKVGDDSSTALTMNYLEVFTHLSRPPSDALPRCFFIAAEQGATRRAALSRSPSPQFAQAICGGKKTTRKCTAQLSYPGDFLTPVSNYLILDALYLFPLLLHGESICNNEYRFSDLEI